TLKLSLPQADAIIDMTGTWVVGVKTADCVPLLLADPRSRMVCAVHAGWRGIVARIVPRVLKVLHKHVGTNDWIVAIGPHIRACHFQVGAEVAEHFVRSSVRSDPRREGAFLVDLSKSLHTQLEEQGIPEAHIEILPYCTHCLPKFFSHRRSQGRCGRMFNFVSGRV
ncbi:MAG: polyphenol oxidase family protein, partial [Myxococcota bacterium]